MTGLTNDTEHKFKIRAVNVYGDGVASDEASATPVPPPAAPTGFGVTALDGVVDLTWDDPSNSTITGWQYQGKTSGDWGDSWEDMTSALVATRSHTVSSVLAAKQFTVNWANPNDDNIGKYQQRRRIGIGQWGAWTDIPCASPCTVGDMTSYTFTGLTPGTSYQFQVRGVYTDRASMTTLRVGGLSNGTAYTFRIRAVNPSGDGAASPQATATPQPAPTAPTLTGAVPGDAEVALAWTYAGAVTVRRWEYSGDDGATWTVVKTPIVASPNQFGFTDETWNTAQSLTVKLPEKPAAAVEITLESETEVFTPSALTFTTQNWNTPQTVNVKLKEQPQAPPVDLPPGLPPGLIPPGGQPVLPVQVLVEISGRQTWANARSATATGLTNGTEYTFRVRGVNAYGNGALSNSLAATPIAKPAKPADFTATPRDSSADLAWTDPADTTISKWQMRHWTGSSADFVVGTGASQEIALAWTNPNNSSITKYQYSTDGSTWTDIPCSSPCLVGTQTNHTGTATLTSGTLYTYRVRGFIAQNNTVDVSGLEAWTTISTTAATALHTAGGLTNDTAYKFRIRAVNASGIGPVSDQASATPKSSPAQATGLAATGRHQSVDLEWTDPGDSAIVRWEYRRKAGGGKYGSWTLMSTSASTTAHTVTGLTNNTAYTFQIRAANTYGPGPASGERTATPIPVPAKPTGLTATARVGAAALVWTSPGNSTITKWQLRHWTGSSADVVVGTGSSREIVLSWTNPNNSNITKWQYSTDGSNWTDVPCSSPCVVGTQTSYALTATLTSGTQYTYRVRGHITADNTVDVSGLEAWTTISTSASATSHTASGLTNNTAYKFRIRAVNAAGYGTPSDEASATPIPVPAAPANLTVTGSTSGAAKATLRWDDPNDSGITGWQLRQWSGSEPFVVGTGSAQTITLVWDSPDKPNILAWGYSYRNASGGGWSGGATMSNDPGATSHTFTATLPSGVRFIFRVQAQVIGEAEVTPTGLEVWSHVTPTTPGAGKLGHVTVDLDHGDLYNFKLRAVNAVGVGDEGSASARPVAGVPEKPTLSASGGDGRVTISWSKGGSRWVDEWEYRKKEGNNSYGSWTDIADSGDSTRSHAVTTGVDNGKTYTFQVRAVNAAGNSTASDGVVVSTVPAKPAGFTAVAKTAKTPVALYTEGQVDLAWTDPSNSTITGWEYRYKSKPAGGSYGDYGNWTAMAGSGASTTSYTVTGLTLGTEYRFQVRAVNSTGGGTASDESAAAKPVLPTPAKPSGLTATARVGSAALAWTSPGNSTITKWQLRHWTGSSADVVVGTGSSREIVLSWTNPNNSNITKWQYSTDGNNWTDISSSSATTRSHTVTANLTSGVQYTYRVRGYISANNTVSATGLEAWTTISTSASATSHTASGLTNNTAYKFRIRAVNAAGYGTPSDRATATPIPVPAAPANLTATGSTSGAAKATLRWDNPNNSSITKWQLRQRTGSSDFVVGTGSSQEITLVWDNPDKPNILAWRYSFRNASGGGWSGWATMSNDPNAASHTFTTTLTSDSRFVYRVDAAVSGEVNHTPTGLEAWSKITPTAPGAGKLGHVATGLAHNTEYRFRLRAVSAVGVGDEGSASARPVAGVPEKPTLSASGGDAQVRLSWSKGGSRWVNEWEYRQKEGNNSYGAWTDITDSGDSTRSHTVTGLDNGKTYTFQVRAVNTAGNSTASGSVVVSTIPAKPAGFTAAAKTAKTPVALYTEGQVDLAWTNPSNSTITRWEYRYKSKPAGGSYGDYGNWTAVPSSGATTTSYTVTGLTLGSEYKFKVRAVNSTGGGTASDESAAAKPVLPTPAKPSGLTATARVGAAALAWTSPGNSTITKWQLRHWTGSSADVVVGTGSSQEIVLSWTNPNNSAITKYQYSVDGANWTDVPCSSPCAVGTQTSYVLTATLTSGTQYTYRVRGYVAANNTVNVSGLQAWTTISTSASATSHTASGLTNNTAYKFRLRAVNAAGYGTPSDQASATPIPVPAAPANLTATGSTSGAARATLRWDNPNNSSITKWQLRQWTGSGPDFVVGTGSAQEITLVWDNPNKPNTLAWFYSYRSTSGGGWSYWQSIGGGPDTTTHTFATTLPSGTRYVFRVQAQVKGEVSHTATGLQAWSKITPTTPGGKLGHVATSLSHNTEYRFRLRAVNPVGIGHEGSATARPVAGVPEKPTLSASGGDAQVTISWSKGGSRWVDEWEYRQKEGNNSYGAWTDITDSGDSTRSHTVTGLDNGKTYTFQVRAVNASGNSTASTGVVVSTIPAKPAGFTAAAKTAKTPVALYTEGQVDLAWTNPSNSTITRWEYRYKSKPAGGSYGDYGNWTAVPSSGATTTSYTVTGLTLGSEYKFKVRAVNSTGGGTASDESAAAKPVLPTPAKPSGLTATARVGAAALAWTSPGNSTITKWQLRHWTGSSADVVVGTGSSQEIVLSWTNPNNSAITKYQYSVDGTNWTDVPCSSPCAVGTQTSYVLTATLTSGTQYTYRVRGYVAANNTVNVSGLQAWTTISTSASATSHMAGGLTNNTAYKFRLRAVNAAGYGTPSDQATATPIPVPAAPANLTATGSTSGAAKATLRWDNPNNSSITKWQLRQRTGSGPDFVVGTGSSQEITLVWDNPNKPNILAWRYSFRNASGGGWSGWATMSNDPNAASHTFTTTLTSDSRFVYRVDATVSGEVNHTATGLQAWATISTSASATSHTATGLAHNTEYRFRVRAVNPVGVGAAGSATARPVAGVPEKPTLSASGGDGRVRLSWSKGGSRWVDEWEYRQKEGNNNYGSWTDIADSGDSTRSHAVTGLDNGKSYTFQVRAVNAAGNSAASVEASVIPLARPLKPSGLAAAGGDGRVVLSWTETTDPSTDGYSYQYQLWQVTNDGLEAVPGNAEVRLSWTDPGDSAITKWQYRKKSGQADYPATSPYGWTDVPSSGATTTSYTVTSLSNGRTYTFQVRAVKGVQGQTPLLEVTATPTAAEGWATVASSDEDTTSHTITNLANGRSYKVRIRALNNARPNGVGPASDAVSFATRPAEPAGFAVSGGDTQVTLSWTDPANSTIIKWQTRHRAGTSADFVVGRGAGTEVTLQWTGPTNSSITKWQFSTDGSSWTDISSSSAATRSHTATANLAGGTRYTYQVRGYISSNNTVAATGLEAWTTVNTSATATSHVVTGLVNGVAYRFWLRAVNAAGPGAASDAVAPSLYPAKPANLKAEPGHQLVVLVWDNPNDASITRYQYQQKEGQGNWGSWTNISGSGASTTSHTVKSLTNGTEYKFKVRAVNRAGGNDRFGAASDEASATPVPLPSQPTGLTASASGTTVTLGWTETTDSDIKGWEYRQKAGSAAWGDWTPIPGSTSTTKSLTRSGLEAGTVYSFRVRAVNTQDVAGPGSAVASAATVPLKPTGLAGSPGVRQVALSWTIPGYPSITKWQYLPREVGSGGLTGTPGNARIALSWTNPNDSSITKWQYRKKESGQSYGDWTDVPNSNASTTSHTETGLTNGTKYLFEVRAFKSGQGQTALDEVAATPTADDGWQDMSPSGAGTTTFNVTGLDSDTQYGFRIRSVNPAGDSPASDEIKVTIPARPDGPQSLTATKTYNQGSDNFTVTLNWTVKSPVDDTVLRWEYRGAPAGTDLNTIGWAPVPGSNKDTRSYVIPVGLTGGSYNFQVRARNTTGGGAASTVATVTLTPAAPTLGAPTATYVPQSRSFNVTWTWTPPSPADASIKSWQYRGASGDSDTTDAQWTELLNKATWKAVPASTGATRMLTATDHTAAALRYQVRAVNRAGGGTASAARQIDLVPEMPDNFQGVLSTTSHRQANLTWDDPQDPSITAYEYRIEAGDLVAIAGDKQVVLRWADPSDSAITGWQYRQKEGTQPYGAWQNIQNSNKSTTSHTVTGLTNNTTYAFRVRALKPNAETSPAAVDRWRLGNVGTNGEITLSWTKPTTGVAITKWQYRQRTGVGAYGDWKDIESYPEVSPSTLTFTTTNWNQNQNVQIKLAAKPPDDVILDLAAETDLRFSKATLTFTPTNWDTDQTVGIRLASQPQADTTIDLSERFGYHDISRTSHTVTGLTVGTDYAFQVAPVGTDGAGNDLPLGAVEVRKLEGVSEYEWSFTAVHANGQRSLTWTDPDDDTIQRYQYRKESGTGSFGAWTDISGSDHTTTSYGAATCSSTDGFCVFEVRPVVHPASNEATATPPTNTGWKEISSTVESSSNSSSDATRSSDGATTAAKVPRTSYTVTGLNPGTTYSFQLRSVNPAGKSPATLNNLTTKNIAIPPPAAPRYFFAVNGDSPRQVRLSWGDPNPADQSIIRWEYRRSKLDSNQSTGWTPWTSWKAAPGGAAAREAVVGPLDLLSTYRFQVRAVGASDGRSSGTAFVRTRGVKVSKTNIAKIQGGQTDTYTVVLAGGPPAGDVVIDIQPNPSDAGICFGSGCTSSDNRLTLTFTTTNWNTAQTVTVKALLKTDNISLNHNVYSHDRGYDGLTAKVAVGETTNQPPPAPGTTLPPGGDGAPGGGAPGGGGAGDVCPQGTIPFTDVSSGHYARLDITCIYLLGITRGVTPDLYAPGKPVTRGQMAAFLARTWRKPGRSCPPGGPTPFGDVASDHFAAFDITCIYRLGITQGVTADRFAPNQRVTRGQMAAFLARTWRQSGGACPSGALPFDDVSSDHFAAADIACLYWLGITRGVTSDRFAPGEPVTRAQMAAFLARSWRAGLHQSAMSP